MADINLLDITSDYIFKLVFGREENKDLLISLLNAIFKGNPHVEDITLQNSEISKILKNNKTIHLDVRAKVGEQEYVDVEIQCRNTGDIIERGIHYLSNMIVEGAKNLPEEDESKRNYIYPKVIGVWIMGENLNNRKMAVNEATMTFLKNAMDDYQIASDKMRLITIELQKFNPKTRNRKDMLDEWITFLKNPMNNEVLSNDKINKALNVLKKVSADEEVREIYRLRQQTEFGFISEKNIAVQKAKEEGEKIGAEKERIKAETEKRKMAKNLLDMGLSLEQVASVTSLTAEEIENLR